jgi:EAL domain-containing protein (putative c-di-GMP-specific phosphodiesterase class I)
MYHAKEQGRNNYQFYDPKINMRSLELIKLENWLCQSIKRGELLIHYQPLVDIGTNNVVSAEALIRWQHPVLGRLEPQRFIPLAEESGFITVIDEWVLRSACRQMKRWIDAGLPPVCVTVNLSARLFEKPDLVALIQGILDETGIAPEYLDLEITEITEGMAMNNVESSAARLRQLAEMGVHISIDDFGTGYSSLNYLKRLPIERLKIDRSFVQDIASDADDRTIIRAVTAMAHNMKMKVIAEGVETEEQLAFLRDTGCDEMQGFLFSRPVPADQFEELIATRWRHRAA